MLNYGCQAIAGHNSIFRKKEEKKFLSEQTHLEEVS